jgi:hypothetical protein
MSDYTHRPTRAGQTFSYEDGQGYRGYHFDTEKAKAHVRYNEAIQENRKGKDFRYVGSIPMELVVKYQSTLPEEERADFWHRFATDKQVKQVFLTWLKKNYPELLPGHSK